MNFLLVPRRGTISLAVGETYGKESRRMWFRPRRGRIFDPSGVGRVRLIAILIRRFHLRRMTFLPFGEMEVLHPDNLFLAQVAGQPQRSFDGRAFEQFHARLGGEAAKVAGEGAADQVAGLEHSAGCDHRRRRGASSRLASAGRRPGRRGRGPRRRTDGAPPGRLRGPPPSPAERARPPAAVRVVGKRSR